MVGKYHVRSMLHFHSPNPHYEQARSKQCMIGPAITKLSAGDLGAG